LLIDSFGVGLGCYLSLKDFKKAQELLDAIPDLIEKRPRKISGKDLPTEVLIKKKSVFGSWRCMLAI
jgi:hypothetical protein